jgi:putative transposase
VVDDGSLLFHRGSPAKSGYSYFQEKITAVDKFESVAEGVHEAEAREEVLRERQRLFLKLYRGLLHYYGALASHLANTLW